MAASVINIVLGFLVTWSAYYFDRSGPDRLLVSAFLGPPIVLFSVLALRYRKASYVAAITGFLLACEAMMKGAHGFILPVDMVLGLLVLMVGLYPHAYLWAESIDDPVL